MAKVRLAILGSDQVTRNHTRFTVGSLHGALVDTWERGLPNPISHDLHRVAGWTWPTTLHLEPGLVRLVGVCEMPESENEAESLRRAHTTHLSRLLGKETAPHLDELRKALSSVLRGDESPAYVGAAALRGVDLARRRFEEIFSREDKYGLVPLADLRTILPGMFEVDGLVLFAHPYFRRSLSRLNSLNGDLLLELEALARRGIASPRIRLDPDLVGLPSTAVPSVELQYWWGPKFNDNLTAIEPGVARHEADERQKFFHQISRTEFWWHRPTDDGEHVLEAEELRDESTYGELEGLYGCRYAHCIVSADTGRVVHLDGAIREYSEEQMVERIGLDISRAGKRTRYTKLWRIDGDVDVSTMKSLVHHHFRDNPLVGEYFGVPQPEDVESGEMDRLLEDDISRFIPYSIRQGSGVRVSVGFRSAVPTEASRCCLAFESSDGGRWIPAELVEIRKLLRRRGHDLAFPDGVSILAFSDLYSDFPWIVHPTRDDVGATVDAFRELLGAWGKAEHDRVIALNLAVRDGNRLTQVSLAGHLGEVATWLEREEPFPPEGDDEAAAWVERIARELSEAPARQATPALEDIMGLDGGFHIERVVVKPGMAKPVYHKEQQALAVRLSFEGAGDSTLFDAVARGALTVKPAFVIRASRCTSCGAKYSDCPCVKFVDQDVGQLMEGVELATLFWTDRPA